MSAEDEARMEEELRNDPKEIAEHVMLVVLGLVLRLDLGQLLLHGPQLLVDEAVHRHHHTGQRQPEPHPAETGRFFEIGGEVDREDAVQHDEDESDLL